MIATLPVGYADGYRRLLGAMAGDSHVPWTVLVHGKPSSPPQISLSLLLLLLFSQSLHLLHFL